MEASVAAKERTVGGQMVVVAELWGHGSRVCKRLMFSAVARSSHQFSSVEFSQSRIGVKKPESFLQTHDQGLGQLFLTGTTMPSAPH